MNSHGVTPEQMRRPPWAEATRIGLTYTLSTGLEGEGFIIRAINVTENYDPPWVRVRVLLPWWSWPCAWITGRRAQIRQIAADFAELCRPAAVVLTVTAGWLP